MALAVHDGLQAEDPPQSRATEEVLTCSSDFYAVGVRPRHSGCGQRGVRFAIALPLELLPREPDLYGFALRFAFSPQALLVSDSWLCW